MTPKKRSLVIKGSLLLAALNWMKYLTTFEVVDKVIVSPPSSNPWSFTADSARLLDILNRGFMLGIESQYDLYVYTIVGAYAGSWKTLRRFLRDNEATLAEVSVDVGGFFREEADDTEVASEPSAEARFWMFLNQLVKGRIKSEDLMARPNDDND